MDIASVQKAIKAPITESKPVGEHLTQDETYDFIEDQMMKVGSLSHGSVKWIEVENSLIKLLSIKTKDIKLLTYLLQCVHHRNTLQSFYLSILILTDFINLYWEDSYPVPGKQGALQKKRYFSQIIQRVSLALNKLNFDSADTKEAKALYDAVHALNKSILARRFDNTEIEQMIVSIESRLNASNKRREAEKKATSDEIVEAKAEVNSSTTNKLSIDSSSSKEVKQSLFKVAEFLSDQNLGVELSIRIRRYAVWSNITALPECTKEGKTLLQAMSKDRIKEYKDEFNSPNLILWQKVEQSLTNTPYWFDGHYMSYRIAEKLNQDSWAKAILHEAQTFIKRLPGLYDLTFKCSTPFISEECKKWLSDEKMSNEIVYESTGDWEDKQKNLNHLAKKSGVEAALTMANNEIKKAKEIRDRYYWQLISAELMQKYNLGSIASLQYEQLYQKINSMSVSEWEPSLNRRLAKYAIPK